MAADLEVGGPGPAYKAVRPVVRSYDWSGYYIGGNVGGHWGVDKVTTVTDVDFEGRGPWMAAHHHPEQTAFVNGFEPYVVVETGRPFDLGGTELVCALPAAPVPALDRLPCNLAWCSASRQRNPCE